MTDAPIRILIHGATGRMGGALLRLAAADPRFAPVAAVSRSGADAGSVPSFRADAIALPPDYDLAIDFSLPEAFDGILGACLARRAALVSGTTGLAPDQRERFDSAASTIPVLWASNFSLGVTVLEELVRRAALALPTWNVALSETHHVHKKDAPSGTALTLARASRPAGGELPPIESIREGEVVGDHRVRFAGTAETIELSHSAANRDVFALGALEAAAMLSGRGPGNYRLGDLLFTASD
jgi:4-hydroxy-tetrahydrodipicolinate reductase